MENIARLGQHEGPYNRFCENSDQEDKLNSSCDSWGHNEAFAATWHQCESCIQSGTPGWVGGLDDQWQEIIHQNWPHAKRNFCLSPPVDPDSVEQCEKIHDHQRVSKGWTAAWWRELNLMNLVQWNKEMLFEGNLERLCEFMAIRWDFGDPIALWDWTIGPNDYVNVVKKNNKNKNKKQDEI